MSLYNVELFKKDFSYVSSYQSSTLSYEYDYLSISSNKLQFPKAANAIVAERGDYIRITDDTDTFFGIVDKVTDSDTYYTIMYKPFLSLFDTNMYMDRETLKTQSLEQWIKAAVEPYFADSGDALQDLNHVNITAASETMNASLDSESNIENLYELLKTALSRYDVSVAIDIDIASGTVNITIGRTSMPERIIEADLPNILSKEFTLTNSSKASINKLYIINEKDENERLVYYLTNAGTIKLDAADSERVAPVLFDTVYASAESDGTFAEAAYEKALTELSTGYDNLIELTVMKSDNLIKPDTWHIGDLARIIREGRQYESILTGKRYDEQTVTLMFGSIRLELTKKVKKEKTQRKTDQKIKSLESKVNELSKTSSPCECQKIVSVAALPEEPDANIVYLIQGEVTVE